MRPVNIFLLLPFASTILAAPNAAPNAFIPDSYFVQFTSISSKVDRERHLRWVRSLEELNADGTVARGLRHEFNLVFQGYSAILDEESLHVVHRSPDVAKVTHVGVSTAQREVVYKEGLGDAVIRAANASSHGMSSSNFISGVVTTEGRGWNANRISHQKFTPGYSAGPWVHDEYLGKGVSVFVLDTGINLQQPGFQGSSVSAPKNLVRGTQNLDLHGHGTMCAAVIAGRYAGLAPAANTYGVKIANDSNRSSCDDVVAGIEYVISFPANNNMKVISLSQYGFTCRPDVSKALATAVVSGVHVVTCAGNNDRDACGFSPGNTPGVINVGSIDGYNMLPTKGKDLEGTNSGKCLTIFAPGSRVPSLSTKNLSSDYHYFSWGTSIAAPQVAALVANRLSRTGPQTPQQIRQWLTENAIKGQIQGDLRGSPNLIAYNGLGA